MALWHLTGLQGRDMVKLTKQTYLKFGLSRHAVQRHLESLQDAGLLLVEGKRGRAPVVTISGSNR